MDVESFPYFITFAVRRFDTHPLDIEFSKSHPSVTLTPLSTTVPVGGVRFVTVTINGVASACIEENVP